MHAEVGSSLVTLPGFMHAQKKVDSWQSQQI